MNISSSFYKLTHSFFLIASYIIIVSFANATRADDPPTFTSGIPAPVPDVFNLVDFLPEFGGFPRHAVGKLDTIDLGNGAYVVTEGVYQALFLVAHNGVILVDAPPSLGTPEAPTNTGETLLDAIFAETDLPVKHLVYSHEHLDHIGGAAAIQQAYPGVKIYAHRETQRALLRAHYDNPDDPRPLANKIVHRKRNIKLGNQRLKLRHLGTAHSPGDLYIYAPDHKILMLVDVIFPKWVPFSSLALTDDVRGYINAHDKVLNFDFDIFIGGHLTRLGDRMDVERAKDYVLAVRNAAGVALGSTGFGDISDEIQVLIDDGASEAEIEAAQFLYFQNPFALFDEFLQDVTEICTRAIVDSEEFDDLAAVDVFTRSHCFTMQNSLRLD